MKNPNIILRDKVYEKLHEAVSVDSTTLKVFDMLAVSGAVKPYIVVSTSITTQADASKKVWTYLTSLSIEIFSEYQGSTQVDDITNQCMQILIPEDESEFPDLSPNFKVHDVRLQTIATGEPIEEEDQLLAREVLTIQYEIDEEK